MAKTNYANLENKIFLKYSEGTQHVFKLLYWFYLIVITIPLMCGEILLLLINGYFGNGKGNVSVTLGFVIILISNHWLVIS